MHLSNHATGARAAARPASLLFCVLAATAITGCGKSDRIPTTAERLSSVSQKQETQPDFYVPRKTVDYMGDLKSLKDAPAAKPEAPVRAEPTRPADAKPVVAETRTAAAPQSPAPAPAPAPATTPSASAPPPNVVASAAPTTRPAAPPTQDVTPVVAVVAREQPEFPREAMKAGIESGTVRAKLTINAAGGVTDVAIVQAQPPRMFDRSVKQALARWKFNAGAEGRTYETEIAFKAAN